MKYILFKSTECIAGKIDAADLMVGCIYATSHRKDETIYE